MQCKAHTYADDVQIYYSFEGHISDAVNLLNQKIDQFLHLSKLHCLTANTSKSQVIAFPGSKYSNTLHTSVSIFINGDLVKPVSSIKNLGITMDSKLKFNKHINSLIKKTYLTLKQLYRFQYILDSNTRSSICQSLMLPCFNFGDIIYRPCLNSTD